MKAFICVTIVILSLAAVPGLTSAAETTATIDADTITEQQGDIVAIPLQLPAGATGQLHLKGDDYSSHIAITDADANGKATLLFNTYTAGTGQTSQTYRVGTGDRISSIEEVGTAPLPAADYTMTLSVDGQQRDRTTLELDAATQIDAAGTYTTAGTSRPQFDELRATQTNISGVAVGNTAVFSFNTAGIGGAISPTEAPSNQLLDTTSTDTTDRHTVTATAERDLTVDSIRVNYDAGDGHIPPSLSSVSVADLETASIDTDQDGIPDRNFRSNIQYTVVTQGGTLSFEFDAPVSIPANSTVVLAYTASVPDANGTDRIRVSFGDDQTIQGETTYGVSGVGTLGNGVDLQVQQHDATQVVDIAPYAVDYIHNASSDTLYIVVPTTGLRNSTANETRLQATLTVTPANRYITTPHSATTSVRVAEPYARFTNVPSTNFSPPTGSYVVNGTTNLMPGTNVQVTIESDQAAYLQMQSATVRANQTVSAEVTFPSRLVGARFNISVWNDDNEPLGEPVSGRVRSA